MLKDFTKEKYDIIFIQTSDSYTGSAKVLADIQISLAGTIAQKVVLKHVSFGCERDLENAKGKAERLINDIGFVSCADVVNNDMFLNFSTTSDIKRRINERKIEKLLRKCERNVKKYIIKHKHEIVKLANALLKKQMLVAKDIKHILSN